MKLVQMRSWGVGASIPTKMTPDLLVIAMHTWTDGERLFRKMFRTIFDLKRALESIQKSFLEDKTLLNKN